MSLLDTETHVPRTRLSPALNRMLESGWPHAPLRRDFTARIREAHQRSGRSLREVAELCDLDYSYVSLILEAKRRPQRDVVISLCAFGWGLDRIETDEIIMLANYPPLGRSALREYRHRCIVPSGEPEATISTNGGND